MIKTEKAAYIVKIAIVIGIYISVLGWLLLHITEHRSSFERYVCESDKNLRDVTTEADIRFEINGHYQTTDGYCLYEVDGWQAEKSGDQWKSTIQGIVLKSEKNQYGVDIKKEKLPYAARSVGAELDSERIAYRAYIPTTCLDAGNYQVGIVMGNDKVVWSDLMLTTPVFSQKYDDEILVIEDPNLVYDPKSEEFTGIGSWISMELTNDNKKESVEITLDAKTLCENTYLLLGANGMVERIDPIRDYCSYQVSIPLENGNNEIWLYCVVDGEADIEAGKEYFKIKDLQLKFK